MFYYCTLYQSCSLRMSSHRWSWELNEVLGGKPLLYYPTYKRYFNVFSVVKVFLWSDFLQVTCTGLCTHSRLMTPVSHVSAILMCFLLASFFFLSSGFSLFLQCTFSACLLFHHHNFSSTSFVWSVYFKIISCWFIWKVELKILSFVGQIEYAKGSQIT